MAGKKWELATAVARHLVKVEPKNAAWWINLACATRRCEAVLPEVIDYIRKTVCGADSNQLTSPLLATSSPKR